MRADRRWARATTSLNAAAAARGRWVLVVRAGLAGLLLVFLLGYAVAQMPHTTWLRGTTHAVEQDFLASGLVLVICLSVGLVQTGVLVAGELHVPSLNRVVAALKDDGAQPDSVLTS